MSGAAIGFRVRDQVISRTDSLSVAAGSRNYLCAEFEFVTPEWEGLTKTAVFTYGGGEKLMLLEGDACTVPWEAIASPGAVYVSVFGGDLITTGQACVRVHESGYAGAPGEPTPDMYAQLKGQRDLEWFSRTLSSVSFPPGISEIRRCFFADCESLTLAELPETVEQLGEEAFLGCTSLTELPTGLTRIGQSAFALCTGLTEITIPEGVREISPIFGFGAFTACKKLKTVTFAGTPDVIGGGTFRGCNRLETVNVPWAEGEVSGAPWGASNATVNYSHKGGAE